MYCPEGPRFVHRIGSIIHSFGSAIHLYILQSKKYPIRPIRRKGQLQHLLSSGFIHTFDIKQTPFTSKNYQPTSSSPPPFVSSRDTITDKFCDMDNTQKVIKLHFMSSGNCFPSPPWSFSVSLNIPLCRQLL